MQDKPTSFHANE